MTPIVLHHGLFGFGRLGLRPFSISYFGDIDRAIAERGHPLIVSGVHPAASISRRAGQLKAVILREVVKLKLAQENRKVTIIAHSMGGLDARYMISHLGMAPHVGALLTVSTPHQGSPFADWVIQAGTWRNKAVGLLRRTGLDFGAIADLTTDSCARFNEQTPDHPDVNYFSISACQDAAKMPPWAILSHRIVSEREGENDGLVSVTSACHGHHLGTWQADHWQTINRRFVWLMRNADGDVAPRYLEAIERIAGSAEATGENRRRRREATSSPSIPKAS